MGRPKKTGATAANTPKKAQSLPGSFDVLTENNLWWDALLRRLSKISRVYGFARVETPCLEDIRLYENFYRQDKSARNSLITVEAGGRQAALRGNFLPSILRAYYQHKIFDQAPVNKWSYSGLTHKLDREGNLWTDYEFGFEIFGGFNHLAEAQVIAAVWGLLLSLGLKDLSLEINHIGNEACQESYQDALRDFLSAKKYELCDDCNDHITSRSLNVFRCPNLDCQAAVSEAPTILDFLDQESHKHFTNILEALDELDIPYQLNPLYTGPDGHSKTNFVIKHKIKDGNIVIGEGGFHDGLMQNLCGKNYCCFGFAGSLLKVYNYLEADKTNVTREMKSDVFLVPLGELAAKKNLKLFRDLVAGKVSVYDHFGQAGVKNQLKQAQEFKAPIALIMGQKEAMEEMVILRDVKSGMQEIISYDKIVEEVKKRLGK